MNHINRRKFIITASTGAAMAGLAGILPGYTKPVQNKLPRWRGFNFLNFFSHRPYVADPGRLAATEQDFKWMADWGFDFVRIPMAYPTYLNYDPAVGRDITPEETVDFREEALEAVEELVYLANKYSLHVNLNLHRAPGFCINPRFREPFNLWKDQEAQDAFYVHWDMWARRFRHVSPDLLSFDLVNEPVFKEDVNERFSPSKPVPGDIYRKVAKGCLNVIHRQHADRIVVADGNDIGALVIPELADLPIAQSCRGYYPHFVSHYQADWVWRNLEDSPVPVWPGVMKGTAFNRKALEDFYQPWVDMVKQGVGVHCGECGCYNKTPHDVFLAWFNDQLDILTSNGIGWGLWNFRGDFGLIDSGRKDVAYEDWYGHKLDRKLLTLLQKY